MKLIILKEDNPDKCTLNPSDRKKRYEKLKFKEKEAVEHFVFKRRRPKNCANNVFSILEISRCWKPNTRYDDRTL